MGQAAQCRAAVSSHCCCCCPTHGGTRRATGHEAGRGGLHADGRTVASHEGVCCPRCGAVCDVGPGGSWDQPEQPELGAASDEQLPCGASAAFAAAEASLAGGSTVPPRRPPPEPGLACEAVQRRLAKAGIRLREGKPPPSLRLAAAAAAAVAELPGEDLQNVPPLPSGEASAACGARPRACGDEEPEAERSLSLQSPPRPALRDASNRLPPSPARAQLGKSPARTEVSGAQPEQFFIGEPENEAEPVLPPDDSDAEGPEVPLGPPPSVGSVGHATKTCKRCCFFPTGRCTNGSDCSFCHYAHERRRRGKRKSKGGQHEAPAEEEPAAEGAQRRRPEAPAEPEDTAGRAEDGAAASMFAWDQATIEGVQAISIPGTGLPTPEYAYGDCVQGYAALGPDGPILQGGHYAHGALAPAGPGLVRTDGHFVCDWDPRCAQVDPSGLWHPYGGLDCARVLGTNPAFDSAAVHPAMGQPMCAYMRSDQPTQVLQQRGGEAPVGPVGVHHLGATHSIVFRPCAR